MDIIIIYYLLGVILNIVGNLVLLNEDKRYNNITGEELDKDSMFSPLILVDIVIWPINSLIGIVMGIIRKDLTLIIPNVIHFILPLQVLTIILVIKAQKDQ